MEPSPAPWISALRHSHDRLRGQRRAPRPRAAGTALVRQRVVDRPGALAPGVPGRDLRPVPRRRAERAGAAGTGGVQPIWDTWNAQDPQAQASDALRADQATLERFESLDADEQARLHLKMFGMELDAAGLARMRVSEHAVHTWDVAVALDPAATLAPDAVALLVDTLDQFAARSGKPDGQRRSCACPPPTRSGTSSWRPARRSRSRRPTARPRPSWACPSCGCPPRRSSAWSTGGWTRATPRRSNAGVELDELRPIFPGY